MSGPAFDKGLESLIAEMLRVHVVDSVFAREAVRRGLPPERLEALRHEVVDRLKHAEESGRGDRDAVRGVLDAALGMMPVGGAVSSLAQSLLDRLVPKGQGDQDAPGDAQSGSQSQSQSQDADGPDASEVR